MSSAIKLVCNFCQKSEDEVDRLVAGDGAYICDVCVSRSAELLVESSIERPLVEHSELTPKELVEQLDQFVVGHQAAKISLSVAISSHLARARMPAANIKKNNVIVVGPSGSGKTLIASRLAQLVKVPIVVVDATSLTESGYMGNDAESILSLLIKKANGSIPDAEKGIIFIDEIDKIAKKGGSSGVSRDIGGEGVQQALLKIVEGADISVSTGVANQVHPEESQQTINTQGILFVCGGAFVGMNKDYEACDNKTDRAIKLTESLMDFGLIPEFIGRFPVIPTLSSLSKKDLVKILTGVDGSVLQEFSGIFDSHNVQLTVSDDAVDHIADLALRANTGARALRAILYESLEMALFDAPSDPAINEVKLGLENNGLSLSYL